MDKIAIFYHIYQTNSWKQMFERQVMLLQTSKLYNHASHIHFAVNGSEELPFIPHKVTVTKRNSELGSEIETLNDLAKFASENKDYKIFYFHTKGITWEPSSIYGNVKLWVQYLEYFNIKRWRECVKLLEEYDCVGTEWYDIAYLGGKTYDLSYYAGNIWWATSEYINKIDKNYFIDEEKSTKFGRYLAEFWIGSSSPNKFNFFFSDKNLYYNPIMPEEYEHL